MDIKDLLVGEQERAFITGDSGGGKSALMRRIDASIDGPDALTISIDSKHEWPARSFWTPWRGKERWIFLPRHIPIRELDPGHYVLRTHYPDMSDPQVRRVILGLLKRKHATLNIDEVNNFAKGGYSDPFVSKALREGRAKYLRVQTGAQRAHKVVEEVLSQASCVIAFELTNPRDRERLAEMFHPGFLEKPEGPFSFWVWTKHEKNRLRHVTQERLRGHEFFDISARKSRSG